MKAKNLSLQNYQLSDEKIFDFMKIMSMLKSNNSNQKFVCSNIFKKYKYSLFSPILSYIIEYIKENGEKTGYIGKSNINDINILYYVINRKIYDLFLKRENGQIDEKETEIKFSDIRDENYYMIGQNEEETLDFDTLKRIATDLIDEDDISLKEKDLNKIIQKKIFRFNIKKKLKNIIGNITRNKANSIIGNYYIDNFDLEKILALNKDFYDNILDLKTFAKLDSSINENKIILFI